MSLYPSYKPAGIRSDWDHTSLDRDDARMALHRHGGRDETPKEAVAWFDDDSGALRRLVADYPDGRRANLKINERGWRLSHTSSAALSTTDGERSCERPKSST